MLQQLRYIIQTLLHSKGSNLLKVVSLGLGLTISILLFARVAYEQSYDTCFEDYDRLYQVWTQYIIKGETLEWGEMNSGPVAGAILENFPQQVESATCTNHWMATSPLYYGNTRFDDKKICADSLFFHTLGIEVLSGNPVQDLQQPDVIYLSESLAKRMFGGEDPVGRVVSYNHERDLTVRGTYADLPDNTTLKAEGIISMPPAWAASQANYSWDGGDSYLQYVRLRDARDAEVVNARMADMVHKYLPEEYQAARMDVAVKVAPLRDTFRGYDEVRRMKAIMLTLGLSILFIAALNYALISISSLSRRAKAVGVQKCSGAGSASIFGQFMLETALVIACALVLMLFLLFAFRDFVEDTTSTKLYNLFTWGRLWVPLVTVLLLFLIGGVIPAQLFARIPVTQVFRRYTEGKKGWKRPLLFVQFAGVAFICGVMGMVAAQYRYVMDKDMGFRVERVAKAYIPFDTADEARSAELFFRSLPYVEDLTAGGNPLDGYSGTMIDDEAGESLFSARFDRCRENYVSFMGMTLLQGRVPRREGMEHWWDEAVVNETFAQQMHWGDDVVGRTVHTMGENVRVVGLLKDFQINGCYSPPMPYIGFLKQSFSGTLYFKLKEPFGDNLLKLQRAASDAYPGKTIDVYSWQQQAEQMYNPVRVLRNAMLVAALAMFLVMLMGLLGYTADEVQRRSKEIAIRKVNGAEAAGILELLGRDVAVVALPALIIGLAASAYVNALWTDGFAVQVPVGWLLYVAAGLALLLVIVGCVLGRTLKIAYENPVVSLKNE